LTALSCACTFACALAAQPAQAGPISLQEALAGARANLDVAIANRGVAAAQADIAAADHAPLPQLTAKLSQMDLQHGLGPGNLFRDKRIDKSLGLDWTWERGDKRGLRTEAARRAAGAAAADRDEVRTQQLLAAWGAYFDLLAAQGRIEELTEVERSARQTAEVARTRLKAGDVAVQDAARAEIEAERAHSDAESAQLDRRRAQLVLAQISGREAEAVTLEARAEWPPYDTLQTALNSAPATETLVEQRADVRAAAERVRAAEASLGGANAQKKSDITWGASFDHYPDTSTRQVELRLSMPLSWGYHYEGEIGRAQAQLEQSRDALDKTRRAAASELQRLRAEVEGAAQRARRFDAEIVPRSRDVAARAELAYGKGALPLTDLLDARRTLRAVLLDALAARADLAKAVGAWQLRASAAALTAN
jgi:cobalt-zinc-cadmium efflux system outer membrane protein